MAPWNRAPPVSPFTDSPTRRPLRSQASRDALAQQHQQPESIRSVTPRDDRPPSFQSGGHEQYYAQQQAYRAVEEELNFNPYDGYASPPPGQDRYTPAQSAVQQLYIPEEENDAYREVDTYDYQPRTQVDMDLHLDQGYRQGTPASYYSHDNPQAYHQEQPYHQEYDDYDEDDKEDKFEDSFEGPVEQWDEKREYDEEQGPDGEPLSPAISFKGGFGLPPQAAHTRRNIRDARRVKLTGGNLVLDRPLPTRLAKFLPRKTGDEFLQSRYTAVTATPDDFNQAGYTLRPTLLNRQTELMIVVTIYNEDAVLFCRTMHGIQKNIAFLCSRKNSATWGPDGWKSEFVRGGQGMYRRGADSDFVWQRLWCASLPTAGRRSTRGCWMCCQRWEFTRRESPPTRSARRTCRLTSLSIPHSHQSTRSSSSSASRRVSSRVR